MEDIEAIIDASKHFKYHEPSGSTPFNRISSLPESKKHLKRAIKERIQLLAGTYISLASFIDDDLVDFLEECNENLDKEKIKEISRIYKTVLKNMDRFRKEIEDFDPFELPTDSTRDALDSKVDLRHQCRYEDRKPKYRARCSKSSSRTKEDQILPIRKKIHRI